MNILNICSVSLILCIERLCLWKIFSCFITNAIYLSEGFGLYVGCPFYLSERLSINV